MTNPLKEFLAAKSPEAIAEFAEKAGTSPGTLRLAAQGYKTGRHLNISPAFAARLEEADTSGSLLREEMSDVCRSCPYACNK
jgi:hypothetical protein